MKILRPPKNVNGRVAVCDEIPELVSMAGSEDGRAHQDEGGAHQQDYGKENDADNEADDLLQDYPDKFF